MKGILKRISALALALTVCLGAAAQIQTRKYRLSRLPYTNTKVVLTGNEMNDAMTREGVKKAWNISPYEFCDREIFEKEKHDSSRFFLIFSETTSYNEEGAGILKAGLFQGSDKKNPYKISSIPLCSATDQDGREFTFLPLLLHALQNDVMAIMKKEINIGSTVKPRVSGIAWDGTVCMCMTDIATPPGASSIAAYRKFDIQVLDCDAIDDLVRKRAAGKIVSYVVAPDEGTPNGRCYKMLIDASSGELYYISSHIVSAKKGVGFLKSDMDAILSHKK